MKKLKLIKDKDQYREPDGFCYFNVHDIKTLWDISDEPESIDVLISKKQLKNGYLFSVVGLNNIVEIQIKNNLLRRYCYPALGMFLALVGGKGYVAIDA